MVFPREFLVGRLVALPRSSLHDFTQFFFLVLHLLLLVPTNIFLIGSSSSPPPQLRGIEIFPPPTPPHSHPLPHLLLLLSSSTSTQSSISLPLPLSTHPSPLIKMSFYRPHLDFSDMCSRPLSLARFRHHWQLIFFGRLKIIFVALLDFHLQPLLSSLFFFVLFLGVKKRKIIFVNLCFCLK